MLNITRHAPVPPHTRRRRRLGLCAVAVLAPGILGHQPAEPAEIRVSSRPYVLQSPYTIRVETKLVELIVAVRDGHGRAVAGLKRDNFQILDDGKQRGLSTFSLDAAAPAHVAPPAVSTASATMPAPETAAAAIPAPARFLARWFDDVNAKDGMAAGDLGRTQTAAKRFVKDALQPGVRIGIFTVSRKQTLDFTADPVKLNDTIAALRPHQRISENGLLPCPRITPYRAYRISQIHDRETLRAVLMETEECPMPASQIIDQADETWRRVKEISLDTLASISRLVDYLGKMPGTRVLLLASSGFFGETLEPQQNKIIDQAVHAGVVINALDAKGLYSEAPPGSRLGDPRFRHGPPTGWVISETGAPADRDISRPKTNRPRTIYGQRSKGKWHGNRQGRQNGFGLETGYLRPPGANGLYAELSFQTRRLHFA